MASCYCSSKMWGKQASPSSSVIESAGWISWKLCLKQKSPSSLLLTGKKPFLGQIWALLSTHWTLSSFPVSLLPLLLKARFLCCHLLTELPTVCTCVSFTCHLREPQTLIQKPFISTLKTSLSVFLSSVTYLIVPNLENQSVHILNTRQVGGNPTFLNKKKLPIQTLKLEQSHS